MLVILQLCLSNTPNKMLHYAEKVDITDTTTTIVSRHAVTKQGLQPTLRGFFPLRMSLCTYITYNLLLHYDTY